MGGCAPVVALLDRAGIGRLFRGCPAGGTVSGGTPADRLFSPVRCLPSEKVDPASCPSARIHRGQERFRGGPASGRYRHAGPPRPRDPYRPGRIDVPRLSRSRPTGPAHCPFFLGLEGPQLAEEAGGKARFGANDVADARPVAPHARESGCAKFSMVGRLHGIDRGCADREPADLLFRLRRRCHGTPSNLSAAAGGLPTRSGGLFNLRRDGIG